MSPPHAGPQAPSAAAADAVPTLRSPPLCPSHMGRPHRAPWLCGPATSRGREAGGSCPEVRRAAPGPSALTSEGPRAAGLTCTGEQPPAGSLRPPQPHLAPAVHLPARPLYQFVSLSPEAPTQAAAPLGDTKGLRVPPACSLRPAHPSFCPCGAVRAPPCTRWGCCNQGPPAG